MANQSTDALSRSFAALSDPTRRAMMAHLERERAVTVSDIARPLPIKLPTVLKHLDVLSNAGLVTRVKRGRVVTVEMTPEPLKDAIAWLTRYERFWDRSLDRLVELAETREAAHKPDDQS